MVIMSVDLGLSRTGIAICDALEMLASPIGTIHEKNTAKLIEKISEMAKENHADLIVFGLPKNMDGSEGASAERARNVSADVEKLSEISCKLWDERCTTKIAHTYLNTTDTRGKKRKNTVDTVSAVIILQDFLDFRRCHPNEN